MERSKGKTRRVFEGGVGIGRVGRMRGGGVELKWHVDQGCLWMDSWVEKVRSHAKVNREEGSLETKGEREEWMVQV